MRVAVTGASGFVGREVVEALRVRGVSVIALGRSAPRAFPPDVETRCFDPNGKPDPAAFAGAGAVVHLAGESVAGRWTPAKKRRIVESRIAGTQTLVASLAMMEQKPSVVVSASAVGYYGDRGAEALTEGAPSGDDFLAKVCAGWEAAARECERLGIRTVCVRTAIALGNGGALSRMKLPFLFFVGGPLGSGLQFVPWIDVRDLAAIYCFALQRPALSGAINAVSPDQSTNARLGHAIGAALGRPASLRTPAFALRLVLGEFAETLLSSQRVVPAVALENGFNWVYPQLESDLRAILRARG